MLWTPSKSVDTFTHMSPLFPYPWAVEERCEDVLTPLFLHQHPIVQLPCGPLFKSVDLFTPHVSSLSLLIDSWKSACASDVYWRRDLNILPLDYLVDFSSRVVNRMNWPSSRFMISWNVSLLLSCCTFGICSILHNEFYCQVRWLITRV